MPYLFGNYPLRDNYSLKRILPYESLLLFEKISLFFLGLSHKVFGPTFTHLNQSLLAVDYAVGHQKFLQLAEFDLRQSNSSLIPVSRPLSHTWWLKRHPCIKEVLIHEPFLKDTLKLRTCLH